MNLHRSPNTKQKIYAYDIADENVSDTYFLSIFHLLYKDKLNLNRMQITKICYQNE